MSDFHLDPRYSKNLSSANKDIFLGSYNEVSGGGGGDSCYIYNLHNAVLLDWTEKQVWILLLRLSVLTCQGLKVKIDNWSSKCFLLIKSAIDFMRDYTGQHDNIKFLVWTGWVPGQGSTEFNRLISPFMSGQRRPFPRGRGYIQQRRDAGHHQKHLPGTGHHRSTSLSLPGQSWHRA